MRLINCILDCGNGQSLIIEKVVSGERLSGVKSDSRLQLSNASVHRLTIIESIMVHVNMR